MPKEIDLNQMVSNFHKDINEDSPKQVVTQIPATVPSVFSIPETTTTLSLRIRNFSSEKDMFAFIKNVETLVRKSLEYKLWVRFLIENQQMNKCALTNEDISQCSLDVHHHPITLFTIVQGVVTDRMQKNKEFSTFDICSDVIDYHFKNQVGYVVLLSNMHEKYHNGFQKIPIELVRGDYQYLLKTLSIDDEERARIDQLCQIKKEDVVIEWSKDNYPGINQSKQISMDDDEQ